MLWEHAISKQEEGKTVRDILRRQGVSTTTLRRLKQSGGILVDTTPVTVRFVVQAGQTLTLHLTETGSAIEPVPIMPPVVYEDDWLLVVNKPSGMAIHPSQGHHTDTLANGVAYYFRDISFTFRPITRLDRYTGGLVLIAKNAMAAAHLSRQAKEGQLQKTYYCITDGVPDPPKGEIHLPIARAADSVIKREISAQGKPSFTRYQTIAQKGDKALLQVEPITGRTHQIRVHLAAIGCPLANDFLYGSQQGEQSFFLWCCELGFSHPADNRSVLVKIPCPKADL
jgi:23S rRNA pseudouridine1911/1915/1917 synthase